ncbi:MAG: S41 family peptidase [Thermoguttaceae bacterium]
MLRALRWWVGLAIFVVALPLLGATSDSAKKKPADDDYELYKTLVDTIDQVERNYVTKVNRRELVESAIRGVLNKLDPYSNYIGPEEFGRFRSGMENEFGGIGIQITSEDGQLRILSPLYGTPAYRAGLQAGDRILEINGKSADGLTLDEAVEKLKGDEGTTVSLTVSHTGQDGKQTVKVRRERIHVDTVLGDHHNADGTWNYMLDPKHRIGYVRLTIFSRDTAGELEKVLTRLQAEKIRGLILDLRFNPGGLLNSAIAVSDLFVAEGRIVSTQGRNSPERTWDAHKEDTFEGFPVVVLVNRFSASASEIVSACLQDHKRAVIVGERTWGKGSVQNVIEMEDGRSALKLTTAGYRRPNGKNIHRFPDAKPSEQWGVMPDKGFEIKLSDREMAALIRERRDRDILPPAHHGDEATKQPAASKDKTDEKDAKDKKKAAFEDRQLQAAVSYLTAELAKAR